jgi:hypothetical protein
MKKMISFMLMLLIMSAASMNAQVRIGDTSNPTPGAVLDLNGGTNKMALLLPVIPLATNIQTLNGNPPVAGMIIYSSGGALPDGVYYWESGKWNAVGGGSVKTITGTDGITVTNGNTENPTVGIIAGGVGADQLAADAVTDAKIANGAVTATKLNSMDATEGMYLSYVGGAWTPVTPPFPQKVFDGDVTMTNVTAGSTSASKYVDGAGVLPGDLCWIGDSSAATVTVVCPADNVFSFKFGAISSDRASWAVPVKCIRAL